jgi:hypothetical protein
MSSTNNLQSLLQNVFRPIYKWDEARNEFTTFIGLSNIDYLNSDTATFTILDVGDLSNNVYLGNASGNIATNVILCNSSSNTAIGASSAAGLCNSTQSEFVGFECGSLSCNINGSFIGGVFAASNSTSISNSILIGTSNSLGLSNISNTISIGGRAGGIGNSNIFIGTTTGQSVTGSSNTFIGHGLSLANIPSYTLSDGSSTVIPATVSNQLYIGTGTNVLIAGNLTTGTVAIGKTNTYSTSCNTSTPTTVISGISLDVANNVRIQSGLAIGCDPGSYTLDVNGQFRATDGYGWLELSNYWVPSGGQTSKSVVNIQSIKPGGSMTLNVTGNITTSDVQSSGYCTARGTASFSAGGSLVLSNIAKPGLLIGTVYETTGSYYTADVVIITGLPATVARFAPTSGNAVEFTVSGSNVTLSNISGVSRTVFWNFTMLST